MNQKLILILNSNPIESDYLVKLCRRSGRVAHFPSLQSAGPDLKSTEYQIVVADTSMADFSSLKGLLKKNSGILITGPDELELRALAAEWPAEYYVDTYRLSLPFPDDVEFGKLMERALIHTQIILESASLRMNLDNNEDKIKEVYSEIKEIKDLINENFIKELEKRIAIEAKYVGFQKEQQKVEKVLRKIYAATDVSSLLDIVSDIKDLIQASGATIYILDENETLGKYLKPLVWDDSFLTHPEFSKYIALLDSQDFAATVARFGQEINITDLSFDKRLSKRYVEHLKKPLVNLMSVPLIYDKEAIGVVEVYNKLSPGGIGGEGFSKEDQEILRGLSEHIAISMTKLNLIQYDALTGLLRPDPFFEKVIQKIRSHSKRRQEAGSFALVMGDVDWFKNYNDRNGHEAGNKLLRELAGILKLSIREEDLLCRYGGEEFLFFLTGVKNLEEACVLTDRIRKNVEEHYFEFQELQPRNNLTMSFGVTLFPMKKLDPSFLMTKDEMKLMTGEADMALAEAKGKKLPRSKSPETNGRILTKNKVCCYSRSWVEEKQQGIIQAYKEKFFQEKRRSERYPLSTILMCKDDGGFKVAKTINLSLSGAKILSEFRLPEANSIDLILVLGKTATPLRSEVIYSVKATSESPYYYSGLRFKDLSLSERQILEDYFQNSRIKEGRN